MLERYTQLLERQRELDKEVKSVRDEIYKLKYTIEAEYRKTKPKEVYSYAPKVEAAKKSSWYSDAPEGVETIRFTRTCTNVEEINGHSEKYGQGKFNDEHPISVCYFRVNNVLVNCGGGHILFHNYSIVNDDEWERMKRGDIPKHLVRGFE